jgi:hypothetical protein
MYFFYPNDGACNYHRVLQPARFCHERYDRDWHFEVGPGPSFGKGVYYFSGLPDVKNASNTLLEIQHLRRNGAKFVWSLDDDWLTIPNWNPARPDEGGLCVYDIMKELSDWIVVSTPYLATTFSDVKEKVLIAPNLLDLGMYPHVESEEFEDLDGRRGKQYNIKVQTPVRVVWVGSETHKGDVDEITEPLDRFLSTYCGLNNGNRAVVIFSGMMPHGGIVRKYLHKGLLYQPMVPFVSYHQILSSINPHIYLAPLSPINFNAGKSNLRIMESWALCAVPLATDWGEYSCIQHGIDGLKCNNNLDFYDSLTELVTNHELRVKLASYGRMRVEEQYNWNKEECRKQWYNVFDTILGYW